MKAALIYPHQLFRENPALDGVAKVYVIEEPLFFTQFQFHKQKLVLHRASMKWYASWLTERGQKDVYVDSDEIDSTGDIALRLAKDKVTDVNFVDPIDDWVQRRLIKALDNSGIEYTRFDSPMFLNNSAEIDDYFVGRRSFSMASFYASERTRRKILVEANGKPVGGKFSFDTENRKKLPKKIVIPPLRFPSRNKFVEEAISYVEKRFGKSYGEIDRFAFPINFTDADRWLDDFLANRLADFGAYEDAISREHDFIFHSVLTPMLNIGLLTPKEIIDKTLKYAAKHEVPINSLEGFIRQIIGWREFMRGVYVAIGRRQRTANAWKHMRKLPKSFWNAKTGIDPVDDVITKVLRNAYSHHIERLMVVGNFMFLTETDPDEAYRWFMELYIDAYDWVMVPNVYGMSQQSDGGSIVTKPYISGSNYIRKMSDHPAGEWCEIWDGLYWRFIAKHEKFFLANHRLSMMPRLLAKMDAEKRERLMNTAENFLSRFNA